MPPAPQPHRSTSSWQRLRLWPRHDPKIDLEMAREVSLEVATHLYNGLALDGLDEHDANAVVAGLRRDLVAADPGSVVREHAHAGLAAPGDLHDPSGVAAAYEISTRILQL